MKNCKKNIFCSLASKKKLLLLLFFIPMAALSQRDSVEEPPPPVDVIVEDEPATYDYDNDYRQYFTYLWEIEDSFRVNERKIPDEQVKKMQEDDNFWYANSEVKKPDEKVKKNRIPLGEQKWFQNLLWMVIIGGFGAFIAIYLTSSNVGLFRQRDVAVNTDDDPNEISQDIFAINYQKEIEKAAGNANYRLAVRLLFLRLLKQMTERNIIQYKHDKTNFDYLVQLQSTSYYNNFFRLTRNYEYSWYGKFPVSEETYKTIRNDFVQFDRQFDKH